MDLDLYLYTLYGNEYGEPEIVGKSVGTGAEESLTIVPRKPDTRAIVAVKRATESSPGGEWMLALGPGVKVTGQNPDGSWVPGRIWSGFPVEVEVLSPLSAPRAVIDVYDNTSGSILYRQVVDLNPVEGG